MVSDSTYKMKSFGRCANSKQSNEKNRLIVTIFSGAIFGFLIGVSFHSPSSVKHLQLNGTESIVNNESGKKVNSTSEISYSTVNQNLTDRTKIWVTSNPRGAERLPPNIVVSESDFLLHRLWAKPSEDLTSIPKYLVTFTVGYNQRKIIDAAVKKPSHEKIGIVDAQPVVHGRVPSLGNEVHERCNREWAMFGTRLQNAEKEYYSSIGVQPSNLTNH